jgi:hypothetical protein
MQTLPVIDSDETIAPAIVSLREKMQAWKVNVGLIDTSAEQTREVIDYVVKHHSHHAEDMLRGLTTGWKLRIAVKLMTKKRQPMSDCAISSDA